MKHHSSRLSTPNDLSRAALGAPLHRTPAPIANQALTSAWLAPSKRRIPVVKTLRPAFSVFCLAILGLTAASAADFKHSSITPPLIAREFRGAWVATVGNIDWPSKPGLTTAQQKGELLVILDRAAKLKLNAILFQVRPACDAFYASELEPWSEYLTGTIGEAPKPLYDPLAFAIAEAHKRGLELHAWFNPYRAKHISAKSPVPATHISRARPDLVRRYGNSLWLDPGEKDVQDYSLRVIMDVVKRYDIDAVHFDDYFYPNEKDGLGKDIEFPDDTTWRRFGATSGLSRGDWRRQNVNTFIQRVATSIKAVKPQLKFGISPFGIWRPQTPPTIQGFDPYARLFADSRKWLQEGWVDYFAPQLYWAIDPPQQSFPVLLNWWSEQNPKQRHIWPGLNSYNVGVKWRPEEIVNQIRITRKQPQTSGQIHWDMCRGLMKSNGLAEALATTVYAEPALVPASPWLGGEALQKPTLSVAGQPGPLKLTWRPAGLQTPWLWTLQTRTGGKWTTRVFPANTRSLSLKHPLPEVVALSAVDRCGNATPPVVLSDKTILEGL